MGLIKRDTRSLDYSMSSLGMIPAQSSPQIFQVDSLHPDPLYTLNTEPS